MKFNPSPASVPNPHHPPPRPKKSSPGGKKTDED
jgi:hypothetical protein